MTNQSRRMDEYLDDWSTEDPFTDSKESDVFAPFEGEVENVIAVALAGEFPLVPGGRGRKSSRTLPDLDERCNKIGSKRRSGSIGTHASSSSRGDTIPSRRKKKPKGMPKRPLSAYNLYFQAERSSILAKQESNGGPRIGFEGMGKIIGRKWRDLSVAEKKTYEKLAEKDSQRYRNEMESYNDMKNKKIHEEDERASQTPTFSTSSTVDGGGPGDGLAAAPLPSYGSSCLNTPGRNISAEGQILHNTAHSPSAMLLSMPPHPTAKQLQGSVSSFPSGDPSSFVQSGNVPQYGIMRAATPPSSSGADQPRSPVGAKRGTVQYTTSPPFFPPASHSASVMEGVPDGLYDDTGLAGGNNSSNFPLPPGMEIFLSDRNGVDRKYRIHYTCYSMTREAAHKYIESVTGAKGPDGDHEREREREASYAVTSPHLQQAGLPHTPPSAPPCSNPLYGAGWMM